MLLDRFRLLVGSLKLSSVLADNNDKCSITGFLHCIYPVSFSTYCLKSPLAEFSTRCGRCLRIIHYFDLN